MLRSLQCRVGYYSDAMLNAALPAGADLDRLTRFKSAKAMGLHPSTLITQ
jgi:hypothetical protein